MYKHSLLSAAIRPYSIDTMDERFVNASDDNVTSSLSSSTLSPEGSSTSLSEAQRYSCALYIFVVNSVIQLIISIIGLAGKFDVIINLLWTIILRISWMDHTLSTFCVHVVKTDIKWPLPRPYLALWTLSAGCDKINVCINSINVYFWLFWICTLYASATSSVFAVNLWHWTWWIQTTAEDVHLLIVLDKAAHSAHVRDATKRCKFVAQQLCSSTKLPVWHHELPIFSRVEQLNC